MSEKESEQQTEEEVDVIDSDREDTLDNSTDEDAEISDHQKEIEALRSELEEWESKAKRVQADYDNFRKRSRSEKEAAAQYRSQPLMEALLPVLDNFKRALDSEIEADSEGFYKGMDMVYRQLLESLEAEGLEEIQAEGETFDPNVHQAVMQVEEEGFESNQIVEELQKGYKLNARVIRPAMVKVNA